MRYKIIVVETISATLKRSKNFELLPTVANSALGQSYLQKVLFTLPQNTPTDTLKKIFPLSKRKKTFSQNFLVGGDFF